MMYQIKTLLGLAVFTIMATASAAIRYEVHHGPLSTSHIAMLQDQDIATFHEYPYLLVGTPEYESGFWQEVSTPTTILVLAYDSTNNFAGGLVAYSAAEPGGHEHNCYGVGKNLYISWVVVPTAYQRRGIARQLVQRCESVARAQGYTDAYLITVVRSECHPMKPKNFIDLDIVWSNLGFNPIHAYKVWVWPTRCGNPEHEFVAEIDNMVQYWHKKFFSGYTQDFVDLLELVYGKGFLELGGTQSIDDMFQGIQLDGKKMLDLGSGLGGVETYLARKYTVDIVGVDPEPRLIHEARARLSVVQNQLKGSVLFDALPSYPFLRQYADASFDVIMSRGALLHVPHHFKIPYFTEMFRVLKPGGVLVIDDWMHHSSYYSSDVTGLVEGTGLPFYLVTPAEYKENLQKAGFSSISIQDTTTHCADRSADAVVRVKDCKEEIEKRFGASYYEYSIHGWAIQEQVFRKRELLTGIIRAYRP